MAENFAQLREAVRLFWSKRGDQDAAQGSQGGRDRGGRAAVTGGRQMDGFVDLVASLLEGAGAPAGSIFRRSRLELPGWFRAEKKWDLLVVVSGELVAAAEFKSQVGPSFGNNFNNRAEEAIGSATDVWGAFREGAFRPSRRPWLGYLMLLEECAGSLAAVACRAPHFPVFKHFEGASYARRYEVLVEKLVRERLYDGACFLTSRREDAKTGVFREPSDEFTFQRFVTPLLAHVSSVLR